VACIKLARDKPYAYDLMREGVERVDQLFALCYVRIVITMTRESGCSNTFFLFYKHFI